MELSDGTLRTTKSGRIPLPETLSEAIERAQQLLRDAEHKLGRYYWFLWDLEKSDLWQPAHSFEVWVKGVGLKWGNYGRYRARLSSLGEEVAVYTPAAVSEIEKLPAHIQRPVRERVDEEAVERGVTPSPSLVRKHAAEVIREEAKSAPIARMDAASGQSSEPESVRVRIAPRNGVSGRSCRELMRELWSVLPPSLQPLGRDLSRAITSQLQDLKRARRERDKARAELACLRERLGDAGTTATARMASNKAGNGNAQGASAGSVGTC